MQKSLIPYMRKLRNHEFAEAYDSISDNLILDGNTSEEVATNEDVALAIDSLQDYTSMLPFLKKQRGQHVSTAQIKELTENRHQYLLSLRGRVTYFMRSPIPEERDAANVLRLWLLKFHEFFKRPSILAQSRLVTNLREDLATSVEISEAISVLDLDTSMNAVSSITYDIRALYADRQRDIKALKTQSTQIRKEALKRLETLWKVLEAPVVLRGGPSYCVEMLNTINLVISDFKALYLSKTTRRANQRLEEDAEETENTDNVDAPPLSPEGETDAPPSDPDPETSEPLNEV